MSEYYVLLTTYGEERLAAYATGSAATTLTQIAVGDGNGVYEPDQAQTALVHELWRGGLSDVETQAGGIIVVEGVLPTNVGGFRIREVGIFDSAGHLFAIAKYPDTFKPLATSGAADQLTIRLELPIGNAGAVQGVIDLTTMIHLGQLVRERWLTVDGLLTAPPGAPAQGATYAVGSPATGLWVGHSNQLAQWIGAWVFADVPLNFMANRSDVAISEPGCWIRKSAAGWVSALAAHDVVGPTRLATVAEALAGIDDASAVTPAGLGGAVSSIWIDQLARAPFIAVNTVGAAGAPAGAAANDIVVVANAPTGGGAFAGKARQLAQFTGAAWRFEAPPDRTVVVAMDTGLFWQFRAGIWSTFSATETTEGVVRLATVAEAQAGLNDTTALTPAKLKATVRIRPAGALVAYVRDDGNDANDGLYNGPGGAFATAEGARAKLYYQYDTANQPVQILIGKNGTYDGLELGAYSGSLYIGAAAGVTNAIIRTPPGKIITLRSKHPDLTIDDSLIWDFTYSGTSNVNERLLNVYDGGNLKMGNAYVRNAANRPALKVIGISDGGRLTFLGGKQVAAFLNVGQAAFIETSTGGHSLVAAGGYAFLGNGISQFTVFSINDEQSSQQWGGGNFAAFAATGARFSNTRQSLIDTNGGGINFLPGNAAGVTDASSSYF